MRSEEKYKDFSFRRLRLQRNVFIVQKKISSITKSWRCCCSWHHHHLLRSCCDALGWLSSSTCYSSFSLTSTSHSSSSFFFRIITIMDSRVTPWFKRKRVSQVKTDYAFQHSTHTVQQRTERYQAECCCCFAPASAALATVPVAAAAVWLQHWLFANLLLP